MTRRRFQLTKHLIESLPAREAILWDKERVGLGLRVKPSGHKAFIVQRRGPDGRFRRVTLRDPDHPDRDLLTLDLGRVREIAEDTLRAIKYGKEVPGAHPPATTFAQVAAEYLERHARVFKKASSATGDEQLIERFLDGKSAFGTLPIASISRQDVVRLRDRARFHDKRDAPIIANRLLALVSTIFTRADKWGYIPPGTNPTRGVDRFRERPRTRFLRPEELARLHAALDAAEGQEHPSALLALRLLILTGARKSEILTLKWEYLDLDREVALLPDSKTGAKALYLGPAGTALLRAAPREAGNPFVCWGRKTGGRLVGLPHIWERIRAAAGLDDVRLHDLRHSHASAAVALGLGLPIVGKLLGHTDAATTAKYAHLADAPLREAIARIQQALTPPEAV